MRGKNGKLSVYALKRVAAAAHLPTPWLKTANTRYSLSLEWTEKRRPAETGRGPW